MNKKEVFFFLIFFLLLKIPQFLMLPDFDTGIYATDAIMVNQGKKLYVDVWTQKPPGLIALFAMLFLISAPSLLSLKILGIFYMALTCISLFFLAKFLFDRKTALYSTLLFIAAAFCLVFSLDGLDSEYFFLLPVLWGSLLFLKGLHKEKLGFVLLGGLSLGFAFFIKQVVFWNFLVVIVYGIILAVQERRYCYYFKYIAVFTAGIILFQIIWMSYFIFNGTFSEMIDNAFLFNLKYIRGSFGLSGYLKQMAVSFGKVFTGVFLIWILGSLKFIQILKKFKNKKFLFLILFFIFSLFGVLTGMRFFGHYFVQIIPGICILSGLFIRDLLKRSPDNKYNSEGGARKRKQVLIIAIVLSGLVYGLVQGYYLNKYGRENPFYRIREISKFVKAKTREGDSIYIWGFPPSIYFLSGRNCPVRFCFLPIPLPDPDPREDILFQLRETLPKIIIKSQSASRLKFPGLQELLKEHYHLIKQYKVYSLNRKSRSDLMQVFMKVND